MDYLDIWNVQTGHRHRSPRSEVSDATLEELRPLVQRVCQMSSSELLPSPSGLLPGQESNNDSVGECLFTERRGGNDWRQFELSRVSPGVKVAGRGERWAGGQWRPLSTFYVGRSDGKAVASLQLPPSHTKVPSVIGIDFDLGPVTEDLGSHDLVAPWLVSWHRQPNLAETMWLADAERCIAWCWIEAEDAAKTP